MEPLPAPKTIKVYCLMKQTGISIMPSPGGNTIGMSSGFYITRTEAEHGRTMAILSESASYSGNSKPIYHIFELEVPNPADPDFGKSAVDAQ